MRIVVKVGSAIVSGSDRGLNRAAIENITRQIAALRADGHEVLLVSSGAIAAGSGRFGWTERPQDLRMKQAAAAVGQLALMEAYEDAFARDAIVPAQILLTREDLTSRQRYLNVRSTVLNLLALRTVPIFNENDSVSTEEIQFGDNDLLSAQVAVKVEADRLVLLSNVDGLYESDGPGRLSNRIVAEVDRITAELERSVSAKTGTAMAAGGMAAKIKAAKLAVSAGIETWIASGLSADALLRVVRNEAGAGTRFRPRSVRIGSRHAWIAFGRAARGTLVIDDGARKAVVEQRKSLLPSGIRGVRGTFAVGDTVSIKTARGEEIARGLVNFASGDVKTIRGRHSRDLPELLGRAAAAEVVHRDNLVVLDDSSPA